jgi:hypothetical protein
MLTILKSVFGEPKMAEFIDAERENISYLRPASGPTNGKRSSFLCRIKRQSRCCDEPPWRSDCLSENSTNGEMGPDLLYTTCHPRLGQFQHPFLTQCPSTSVTRQLVGCFSLQGHSSFENRPDELPPPKAPKESRIFHQNLFGILPRPLTRHHGDAFQLTART